jgi:hypothetical protein
VARECGRGLAEAHRLTQAGVFRTLALGTTVNRTNSSAHDAVAQVVKDLVSEVAARGSLALAAQHRGKRQRRTA